MFDAWGNVLAEIEKEVGEINFKTWFVGVNFGGVENETAIIETPGVFKSTNLESKFNKIIENSLRNHGLKFKDITYKTKTSSTVKKQIPKEVDITEIKKQISKPIVGKNVKFENGLNSKYTIDNFIVGSNNDLAFSVAKAVIENPGTKNNPFFLYSGPGLGKTHLVQAIGNEIVKNNPKAKVLYTPINHFYSEFIDSLRKNTADEFKKKFRKLDVLIIDDFQFIINKDKSQEEFFNIFNDLYQNNKQIIVTSDRLPHQIQTVDERLASRLTWAGAIDMQMPSFEDKCAILKSKAEFEGIKIEDEAIEYLAENVRTNIRDLEGELNKLLVMADLKQMTPLELINGGYISTSNNTKIRAISPKKVVEKVAKYYQLSVKEMCGKSRVTHIKTARQVAMFLLIEELGMSTPKVALEVGVKDHTTVLHGVKKIKQDMKLNFGLREQLAAIRESLYV